MELYYRILCLLLDKTLYEKYKDTIHLEEFKTAQNNTLFKLFTSLKALHEISSSATHTPDDLQITFKSLYPVENSREYDLIFNKIKDIFTNNSNQDLILHYLNETKIRTTALEIAKISLEVSDGITNGESFLSQLKQITLNLDSLIDQSKETDEDKFVSTNLEYLYEHNIKDIGLRWRLKSLNTTLGSLRKGDFGFIFARPETGKTTFLASEVTYMASQLSETSGPVLWFNNEEQGEKVMLRCYQAALEVTIGELQLNISDNHEKYKQLIGNKLKIYDSHVITKTQVETILSQQKPSLIVFDQIDKIEGFKADREDLKLGEIYKWARNLAKMYCPIIGICQADGSGEGVKALNMSHVANAKTAKQAEADFILGIGKSHQRDEETIRYFNIAKNKLFGDNDSDPQRKHDFWEVLINPSKARYYDFSYNNDNSYSR